MKKLSPFAICALLLFGCNQTLHVVPIKTYEGPIADRGSLSFLAANTSINFRYNLLVRNIDGTPINVAGDPKIIPVIHTRPGKHQVTIDFFGVLPVDEQGKRNSPSLTDTIELNTLPGHSYIIKAIQDNKQTRVSFTPVDMGLNYPDECLIQVANQRSADCKP